MREGSKDREIGSWILSVPTLGVAAVKAASGVGGSASTALFWLVVWGCALWVRPARWCARYSAPLSTFAQALCCLCVLCI